jgi:chromosome segregation ATPase
VQQRPYRDFTIEEIKDRLESIERKVEELKRQFTFSDPTADELEDLRTKLLPELQRLGAEQSELFQEMALRSRPSGTATSPDN